MMSEGFGSLAELAFHLAEREVAVIAALEHGLDRVLEKVETTARDEIGVYQAAAGPFPAWAELAESTEAHKAAAGYPADAPLLASGEMRDSLERERQGLEGGVGTPDPKMVFNEFGTSKMPARPVLGPAAFRNRDTIEKLVGAAAIAGLIGGDRIHEALGYDFETK